MIDTLATFDSHARSLQALGWLSNLTPVEPGVYVATSIAHGWGACAMELARLIPNGQFGTLGSGGGNGLRWGMARRTEAVIICHDIMPNVCKAQGLAREVMGLNMLDPLPWTVGGNARALLKWSVPPQAPLRNMETLRYDTDEGRSLYQYHDCQPGVYPSLTHWDGHAYYYNLLRRLPSPHVRMTARGLVWNDGGDGLSADDWVRWRDLLDALGGEGVESKVLRNALWGAALGGTRLVDKREEGATLPDWKERLGGRCQSWTSARPKDMAKYEKTHGRKWAPGVRLCQYDVGPGPLRPMAIMLARSAAELCSIASEQVGSVYSTVDSVTTATDARPAIWDRYGLAYRPKAQGAGHIVACGIWRIGGKPTKHYSNAMTTPTGKGSPVLQANAPFFHPTPPHPVARHTFDTTYHQQWLSPA